MLVKNRSVYIFLSNLKVNFNRTLSEKISNNKTKNILDVLNLIAALCSIKIKQYEMRSIILTLLHRIK
jgi:hypothetical protein